MEKLCPVQFFHLSVKASKDRAGSFIGEGNAYIGKDRAAPVYSELLSLLAWQLSLEASMLLLYITNRKCPDKCHKYSHAVAVFGHSAFLK